MREAKLFFPSYSNWWARESAYPSQHLYAYITSVEMEGNCQQVIYACSAVQYAKERYIYESRSKPNLIWLNDIYLPIYN
jgi:hypothetical protein